jgi:bifunctional non-homologous end joining protein LigD
VALTFAIKTQAVPKRPPGAMKRDSATPASVPHFPEPMKAKLVNSIPTGDWIYEVKFDGYRALALRAGPETRLFSRNQKDLCKKFPEILDAIARLDVQDAIVDGEIAAQRRSPRVC